MQCSSKLFSWFLKIRLQSIISFLLVFHWVQVIVIVLKCCRSELLLDFMRTVTILRSLTLYENAGVELSLP